MFLILVYSWKWVSIRVCINFCLDIWTVSQEKHTKWPQKYYSMNSCHSVIITHLFTLLEQTNALSQMCVIPVYLCHEYETLNWRSREQLCKHEHGFKHLHSSILFILLIYLRWFSFTLSRKYNFQMDLEIYRIFPVENFSIYFIICHKKELVLF